LHIQILKDTVKKYDATIHSLIMTTIKVTVKTNKDAGFLVRLLKSLEFVSHIESIPNIEERKEHFHLQAIERLLQKFADKSLFSQIDDPIKYQKQLRDEWV